MNFQSKLSERTNHRTIERDQGYHPLIFLFLSLTIMQPGIHLKILEISSSPPVFDRRNFRSDRSGNSSSRETGDCRANEFEVLPFYISTCIRSKTIPFFPIFHYLTALFADQLVAIFPFKRFLSTFSYSFLSHRRLSSLFSFIQFPAPLPTIRCPLFKLSSFVSPFVSVSVVRFFLSQAARTPPFPCTDSTTPPHLNFHDRFTWLQFASSTTERNPPRRRIEQSRKLQ